MLFSTGGNLSASYTSLLTWLLSLVPDDACALSVSSSVPFNVVGLQQMYSDNRLGLYVAVVPAMTPIPVMKGKKGKVSALRQSRK